MNYTQNYHLPQWVESDRILMEDFNEAMTNLENGISSVKRFADSLEVLALSTRQIALDAQKTARGAFSPDQKPYHTGTYVGDGRTKIFALTFKPSFVMICGMKGTITSTDTSAYDRWSGATGGNALSGRLEINNSGFTIYARSSTDGAFPDFTEAGRVYDYIAFK